MSAPTTFISFGEDGLPDSEWLGIHENHARQRGETIRADALRWMIDTFDKYTVLSSDQSMVQAGSYRLFEFVVSLEEAEHYKKCALSPTFPNPHHPTYSEITKDELHACAGNFIALTQFAAELDHLGVIERWTATVPENVPDELSEFVSAYLTALTAITEVPAHREALGSYSSALVALIRGTSETFAADAGRVHAHKVLLHAR